MGLPFKEMLTYETILAALVSTGALYLIVSKCRCFIRTNTNGEGGLEWGFGFTANDVLVNRQQSSDPDEQNASKLARLKTIIDRQD